MSQLVAQVRAGWELLAAGAEAPQGRVVGRHPGVTGPRFTGPRFTARLEVAVSAGSLICPPGWVGLVVIAGEVLATAPDPELAVRLERALSLVPIAGLTDPGVLGGRLVMHDLLGPASLAYLQPACFRARAAADVVELAAQDPALGAFRDRADPAELEESGLADIQTPAFAVFGRAALQQADATSVGTERAGQRAPKPHPGSGRVVSAAGYSSWPNGFAHLSVLTAAQARGQGLARAAGSAAVAHALQAGLLPQWRARSDDSRAIARSLGFTELGAQVSVHLGPDRHDPRSA